MKKENRVLPTKKKSPFEVIENSRRTYFGLETPPPNKLRAVFAGLRQRRAQLATEARTAGTAGVARVLGNIL